MNGEGFIHFWLTGSPDQVSWTRDREGYVFPEVEIGGAIRLCARKHANNTLSMTLRLATGEVHDFLAPIPLSTLPNAICIDVAWKDGALSLYLEGRKVAQRPLA